MRCIPAWLYMPSYIHIPYKPSVVMLESRQRNASLANAHISPRLTAPASHPLSGSPVHFSSPLIEQAVLDSLSCLPSPHPLHPPSLLECPTPNSAHYYHSPRPPPPPHPRPQARTPPPPTPAHTPRPKSERCSRAWTSLLEHVSGGGRVARRGRCYC